MRKINLALLGQGRSGYAIHGLYLKGNQDLFNVVAVVDALPERRAKAEAVFGCKTYEKWQDIVNIPEIDLCVNAFLSPDHYPVTMELLKAGKHVLVDKPAAGTPEQLDEMARCARDAGRKLMVFQQSRYAPYYTKVQEVLASGVLGRPVQISIAFDGFARRWDWQTLQSFTAGSLYNTGPHPVDQALDLLGGEEMPDVFCKMDRALTFGDAEDYVKLLLTLPNRPVLDVSVSSCNAYPSGTYNIQATRGGLWSDMRTVKWRWFEAENAPEQHLITTPLTTPEGEPAYCWEKLPWQEDSWTADEGQDSFNEAVRLYYEDMYKYIVDDRPMRVTVPQVRRQIAVIKKCHDLNPLSQMEV